MEAAALRSRAVQSLSDNELFETIAYGVKHRRYPHAFIGRGLTVKQIQEVMAYIRQLAPRKH